MRIHLYKFIDRLRGSEARGTKDFTMSLNDAKDLHADITRLLLDLQTLQEIVSQKSAQEPSITVEMQGGTFR